MKQCPKCEKMNSAYAGICEFCGTDIRLVSIDGNEKSGLPDVPHEEPNIS